MRNKRNRQKARLPTATPNQAGLSVTRQLLNTGYSEAGASLRKPGLAGWIPQRSSPQSDIDANLPMLRGRAADLAISTPVAASLLNTSRTNVIGAGLRLSPKPKYKLLGISAQQAEDWAKSTREDFDLWASSKHSDLQRKNNWYEQQDIAYMTYMIDGDSFAVFRFRPPNPAMPYSLRIQLIEASRICNPGVQSMFGTLSPWTVTVKNPNNGNRIINGVEVDGDGAVLAYWISNRYPYDPANMLSQIPEWQRVEAYGSLTGMPNILQISHDDRPEQYRGVPYFSPVIESMKQVGRYTDTELTSAIIKACLSLFIKEQFAGNGQFPLQQVFNGRRELPPIDTDKFELGPATINVLPPGYDVTTVDAQRSLSTFEPFTKQLITQIGAAMEQPYEVVMKAFNSSYTASRAALLQAWAAFKTRRIWFSRDFCQPSYEAWLVEAIARGRVKAPGFFADPLLRKAWSNAEWYGPVMGVLDPVKEIQASALRQQYGISTGEKEAAEMTGTDWEENVERLAIERSRMQELGLPVLTADVPTSEQAVPEEGGEKTQ